MLFFCLSFSMSPSFYLYLFPSFSVSHLLCMYLFHPLSVSHLLPHSPIHLSLCIFLSLSQIALYLFKPQSSLCLWFALFLYLLNSKSPMPSVPLSPSLSLSFALLDLSFTHFICLLLAQPLSFLICSVTLAASLYSLTLICSLSLWLSFALLYLINAI